jgi:hypothetical protein
MLRDAWVVTGGVPKEAFIGAGDTWKATMKDTRADSGKGEVNYPLAVALNGAGSADFGVAAQNAGGGGYAQWVVSLQKTFWQTLALQWSVMEFSKGKNSYENVVIREIKNTASRFHTCMSVYVFGNGGGAVARIRAGSTVTAGTTTIQLRNINNAIRFSEAQLQPDGSYSGGDWLQFSTDDGLGGAGVKAFKTRVIGVNWSAGELTVQPALDGTVTADDYIFWQGTYGRVAQGMEAWNPQDVNDLAGMFNGIDRTTAPDKLGGSRVLIGLGDDPYGVITQARETCAIRQIKANRCVVTPIVWRRFENSLRESGVTITVTKDVPGRISMGIRGLQFVNPATGEDLVVYSDPFLSDINQTRETDEIYRFYRAENCYYGTSPAGINWRDEEGRGHYLREIPDTELVKAYYGARGNFYDLCPRDMMVMSPDVVAA